MSVFQAMQLALALLASVQSMMGSGILDPDEPLEMTHLGDAHKKALEDLNKLLGNT